MTIKLYRFKSNVIKFLKVTFDEHRMRTFENEFGFVVDSNIFQGVLIKNTNTYAYVGSYLINIPSTNETFIANDPKSMDVFYDMSDCIVENKDYGMAAIRDEYQDGVNGFEVHNDFDTIFDDVLWCGGWINGKMVAPKTFSDVDFSVTILDSVSTSMRTAFFGDLILNASSRNSFQVAGSNDDVKKLLA